MKFLSSVLSLLAVVSLAFGFDTTSKPVAPDGTYAVVDLPTGRHVRNIGGSDGAGLCVYTSVQHGADWHQVTALQGFQKWASRRPGGSYPEKLDADITAVCASQGVPVPAYIQHVGGDEAFLDLAIKTGRMLGVTYAGCDGFYDGPIAHMVNLAHFDATRAAIIDNNRPGQWIWMTRQQFLNRWRGIYDNGTLMTIREGRQTYQVGGGWAFCFLALPPPPYTTKPSASAEVGVGHPPEVKNFGIVLQAKPAEAAPPGHNFGIDSVKIRTQNRRYLLNGHEVGKSVAEAAVLSDDSQRFSLTFVGVPKPSNLPESITTQTHIQVYRADEWEVAQFGLKPGVTVRKPQSSRVGSEVLNISAYDDAAVLAAIDKTDKKDPPKPPVPSKLFSVEMTGQLGVTPFTLTIKPVEGVLAPLPKQMPSSKPELATPPREVAEPAKIVKPASRLLIDGRWHTERDGVYYPDAVSETVAQPAPATAPAPFLQRILPQICPNGRFPLQR